MTGNLKIISDSRIHKIVSKGSKYDFGNRRCKREGVDDVALNAWKRRMLLLMHGKV